MSDPLFYILFLICLAAIYFSIRPLTQYYLAISASPDEVLLVDVVVRSVKRVFVICLLGLLAVYAYCETRERRSFVSSQTISTPTKPLPEKVEAKNPHVPPAETYKEYKNK